MEKLSGLSGSSLRNATEGLISYFGIRLSKAKLVRQLKEKGYITNVYGRIIKPKKTAPHLLYNYFIQSSAVDAALLGFSNGIDLAKKNEWKVRPLFIIHDAMIIDVHPDSMQYICDIEDACTHIPSFNEKFHVEFEEIVSA